MPRARRGAIVASDRRKQAGDAPEPWESQEWLAGTTGRGASPFAKGVWMRALARKHSALPFSQHEIQSARERYQQLMAEARILRLSRERRASAHRPKQSLFARVFAQLLWPAPAQAEYSA
jgi:hypothetical protein